MRASTARRIRSLEARRAGAWVADRSPWDWYADTCPCELPAGQCPRHPRARPLGRVPDGEAGPLAGRLYEGQVPPEGDWQTWVVLAGRGFGKTIAASQWVRREVESGRARWVALVGPTARDVRRYIVEGPTGILSVSPPWFRPRYEPSLCRLTWPNGALAFTYSADEPDRLRGPQHDLAYCDELAAFRYPAALDNLLLGLRLGSDPRLCVTTTPRPVKLLTGLLDDPTTVVTRGTTYQNQQHLAPKFFQRLTRRFEGTRLGRQELYGEVLNVGEGAWFPSFDPERHVGTAAEYSPGHPVHLAIDHGVSKHTGAVWFQVRPGGLSVTRNPAGWVLEAAGSGDAAVTVFGDFHAEGLSSEQTARAVYQHGLSLPSAGRLDRVRVDPYGMPATGMGITAYREFGRVFGSILGRWPQHRVQDGLDQLEVLLDQGLLVIHPRCRHLREAFLNYSHRRSARGDWLDEPADPQHPHEDLIDCLRGGIRDRFPEGRIEQPQFFPVKGY